MSEIHALSGAYAVDALDDVERARFEAHLAGCADCRAEVDSLREAAAQLGRTATAPPPPSLRDRVLADITTVRPLPPAPTDPRAGDQPTPDAIRLRRWLPALVAAAVVAVLSAVGLTSWQPWEDEGRQPALTATERVLQADDATRIRADLPAGGSMTFVRSEKLGKAVLVASDVAPAPKGRVYEVWLQNPAGAMVPAGLMSGGGDQAMLVEGDVRAATAAGVTIEPVGGSMVPTTQPIALFEFEQPA